MMVKFDDNKEYFVSHQVELEVFWMVWRQFEQSMFKTCHSIHKTIIIQQKLLWIFGEKRTPEWL